MCLGISIYVFPPIFLIHFSLLALTFLLPCHVNKHDRVQCYKWNTTTKAFRWGYCLQCWIQQQWIQATLEGAISVGEQKQAFHLPCLWKEKMKPNENGKICYRSSPMIFPWPSVILQTSSFPDTLQVPQFRFNNENPFLF